MNTKKLAIQACGLLALLALGGCGKTQEDLVQDCVKAHMKAHHERVEEAKQSGGGIFSQRAAGNYMTPAEVEAEAHRTCLQAASGK